MTERRRAVQVVNHALVRSRFGTLGIAWQRREDSPTVQRVFLPNPRAELERRIVATYPGSRLASCASIDGLAERVARFLQGEAVQFELTMLALHECSPFQQRVLVAESQIPRGWVSTYGRIATHLGSPRGARAVGGALARNPFPIIIPCHRAIRSNGSLGGFQGGQDMKRALLQMEGIEFCHDGRVAMQRVHY